MTLNDMQQQAYDLFNPDTPFNPEAAIAKKWLELKQQGVMIGVPLGPEQDITDGSAQRAQSFTSGAVLVWENDGTVTLH